MHACMSRYISLYRRDATHDVHATHDITHDIASLLIVYTYSMYIYTLHMTSCYT